MPVLSLAEVDTGRLIYATGSLILLSIVGLIGVYWKRKRRRAFRRMAGPLGLELMNEDLGQLGLDLGMIESYSRGWSQEVLLAMRGSIGTRDVIALDFHYREQTRSAYLDYYFSGCIFLLKSSFPYMLIRPEVTRDTVAAAVGFEDIDFESDEFSRQFYVQSPEPEFAYDVCNPLMMEWLLGNPDWKLEFGGCFLSVTDGNRITRWSLTEFRKALSAGCEFLDRIPDFVWTKHNGQRRPTVSWLSSTKDALGTKP
ncbi:MAG TPA: hypothetical protein VMZ92_08445 [Planctomycetota bacterium]|nr:hypothetical protein [Planctomycetota bacterium]